MQPIRNPNDPNPFPPEPQIPCAQDGPLTNPTPQPDDLIEEVADGSDD